MKNFYLSLLLFIPFLTAAQSNYKKGYVINLKGDTSTGYIDYKEWERNPKTISFKSALKSTAPQLLSTANVSSFAVNGYEYYDRYILDISLDAVNLSELSTGPNHNIKRDTVFLRVLQKGKNITLFSYLDGIKIRFYIKDKDSDTPQELIYSVLSILKIPVPWLQKTYFMAS